MVDRNQQQTLYLRATRVNGEHVMLVFLTQKILFVQ